MAYHPDSLERRDAALIARALPVFERFNRSYFRLEYRGNEHVPRGPALFVSNHNGGIAGPDLPCTLGMLWRLLGPESPLFALAHDFAMRQFTPLGRLLQRFGALSASRNNALRVLGKGGQVLVYPGGDLEAYRSFRRRNEVVILPRTGFVEVAREMGAEAPATRRNLAALALAAARHAAPLQRLPASVPTLLLFGELDSLAGAAAQSELRRELPNAQYQLMGGSGHDISLEQPRELAERVLAFALGTEEPSSVSENSARPAAAR